MEAIKLDASSIWWSEIWKNDDVPQSLKSAIMFARSDYLNNGEKANNATDPALHREYLNACLAGHDEMNRLIAEAQAITRAVVPSTTVQSPGNAVSPVQAYLSGVNINPSFPGPVTEIQVGNVVTSWEPAGTASWNPAGFNAIPKQNEGPVTEIQVGNVVTSWEPAGTASWNPAGFNAIPKQNEGPVITDTQYNPGRTVETPMIAAKIAGTGSYYKEGDLVIDGVNYGRPGEGGAMIDPVTGGEIFGGQVGGHGVTAQEQVVDLSGAHPATFKDNIYVPDDPMDIHNRLTAYNAAMMARDEDSVNVKKYAPYLIGAAILFFILK